MYVLLGRGSQVHTPWLLFSGWAPNLASLLFALSSPHVVIRTPTQLQGGMSLPGLPFSPLHPQVGSCCKCQIWLAFLLWIKRKQNIWPLCCSCHPGVQFPTFFLPIRVILRLSLVPFPRFLAMLSMIGECRNGSMSSCPNQKCVLQLFVFFYIFIGV